MIRNADLITYATSGLNASSKLLATTGNNIANVNSEGYVRERTEFTARLNGGVDFGFTDRVFDVFAQNQLRRDSALVGEYQAFYDRVQGLDNTLASDANSISAAMTRFFDSIQTASDDPTSMPSRDAVIGEAQGMLNRLNQLAEFMKVKELEVEQQIEASVSKANNLIRQIGELNEAIQVAQGNSVVDTPTKLLNQRDQAVLELSELVAIEVRTSSNVNNGGIVVNLKSGESLVLADGAFNVFSVGGTPDYNNRQLQLSTSFARMDKNDTQLNVLEQNMGGALGGLFSYREQVLEPAQRDLGKLATVLADSVNIQNRRGMDLDEQLGSNLFAIAEFNALNYPENNDLSSSLSGRIIAGQSGEMTNDDYQITVLTAPSGVPASFDIEVMAVTNDGAPQVDENNNPITQILTVTAGSGTYNPTIGGIELMFASGSNYSVGDQFLIQPARRAAENLKMATVRGEDLAFAKPIRVDSNTNNLGDAQLVATQVDVLNSGGSAFNSNGTIHNVSESPSPLFGAPVKVRFNSADSYSVLDSDDNVITSVSGITDMNNLIAQARDNGSPAWPAEFAVLGEYPGYDFSLQGVAVAGDEFSVSYNNGGINDNRNALDLGALTQAGLVRQSSGGKANAVTYNEAFATIVGNVGAATGSAKINLEAAKVMQTQSSEWFESSAGVNLDEEAANMIQFQQSYAAAARILSAAQEMFNTILQVAR